MADFTNIDGVYAKDTELRSGIDTLRTTVLSNTIKPLTVTKNGTYTAIPSSGTYGYSPITVDVQEEPWQPLQDGYSNFWFELTNDTLSPWLNFSDKNANATIDWGDGSGEVALDTLTPTHTYAKAGRYVVKVKGVTGIARQLATPYTDATVYYSSILKNVELNNEVTRLEANSFWGNTALENIIGGNISLLGFGAFAYCSSLRKIALNASVTEWSGSCGYAFSLVEITLPQTLLSISANIFNSCISLQKITLPAQVNSLGVNVFNSAYSLAEIHVQATTPPTLGNNVFNNIAPNYIIYVPVGYGDTYKAASGWDAYADHIVEEGSQLSVSQLRKIAEETDNGEEMR